MFGTKHHQRPLFDTGCQSDLTIYKQDRDYVYWQDGVSTQVTPDPRGWGGCDSYGHKCYPEFSSQAGDGIWRAIVFDRYINRSGPNSYGCFYVPNGPNGSPEGRIYSTTHTCSGCTNTWLKAKCFAGGEDWNEVTCGCDAVTPILIDINGDGFSLTDAPSTMTWELDVQEAMMQSALAEGKIYGQFYDENLNDLKLEHEWRITSGRCVGKDLFYGIVDALNASFNVNQRRYIFYLLSLINREWMRKNRRSIAYGIVQQATLDAPPQPRPVVVGRIDRLTGKVERVAPSETQPPSNEDKS